MIATTLIIGCGTAAQTRDTTAAISQAAIRNTADIISMDRGPCHGTCPVFSIEVKSDGAVTFDGTRNVVKTGKATGRITADLARSLFRHADSIKVAGMANAYTDGSPTCGGYVTDLPTVTLTLRTGDAVKTVVTDYGCANLPRALRPLHARMDSIARALGWIPNE